MASPVRIDLAGGTARRVNFRLLLRFYYAPVSLAVYLVGWCIWYAKTHELEWSSALVDPALLLLGGIWTTVSISIWARWNLRDHLRRLEAAQAGNKLAVRIVAQPPGVAPTEIRNAWVGVVIPLPPKEPVFPRPRHFLTRYIVHRDFSGPLYTLWWVDCVEALERVNPSAAAWWRKKRSRMLIFPAACCELVEVWDDSKSPAPVA